MDKTNNLENIGNLDLPKSINVRNITIQEKNKAKLKRLRNIEMRVFLYNDLIRFPKKIETLGEVTNYTPSELDMLGFRTRSVIELNKLLRKYGLNFREENY